MTTRTFSIVHVSGLAINDAYALAKSTVDQANPVKTTIGDLAKAALANMETATNALAAELNKTLKSALTEQLEAKDLDRDERWAEIKRLTTTNEKGRDAAKKAAATALHIFFTPYWNLARVAFNTETAEIKDMLTKYNANAALKTQATSIGIATLLTELGTVNTDYETLYLTRNSQEGVKMSSPSASSLKSAVVKSYNQFCMVIEQAYNLTPNASITSLFNNMEELRTKYAVLATKKAEEPVLAKA